MKERKLINFNIGTESYERYKKYCDIQNRTMKAVFLMMMEKAIELDIYEDLKKVKK